MKVTDLQTQLNLKLCSGEAGLNNEITGGYVSDLLSDVMGNAEEGMVWITLQTHLNVMAIASLKDLAAIVLVNDFGPDEDTRLKSDAEQIPILTSPMSAFETAGKLYELIKT